MIAAPFIRAALISISIWLVVGVLFVYFAFRKWVSAGSLVVLVLVLGPIVGFTLGSVVSWTYNVLLG